MDAVVRALTGSLFGGGFIAATPATDTSTMVGIVIFAVGIVVGLACVLAMDWMVRRRMRRDHSTWVALGRPERRVGERRAADRGT